jgi:hypothetical protein
MLSNKIGTVLVAAIASVSFGGAAIFPGAALASKKQGELKEKGYTCEHTADNFTVCTDKEGHEWWCEESTDTCEQIKREVTKTPIVRPPVAPVGVLKAPEVTSPPPTRPVLPRTAGAYV